MLRFWLRILLYLFHVYLFKFLRQASSKTLCGYSANTCASSRILENSEIFEISEKATVPRVAEYLLALNTPYYPPPPHFRFQSINVCLLSAPQSLNLELYVFASILVR